MAPTPDATNSDAVLRVFEMKGRPRFNPLIAHVADRETAEAHARALEVLDSRERAELAALVAELL